MCYVCGRGLPDPLAEHFSPDEVKVAFEAIRRAQPASGGVTVLVNEELRSTRHNYELSETLPVEVQIGPIFVDEGSNLT